MKSSSHGEQACARIFQEFSRRFLLFGAKILNRRAKLINLTIKSKQLWCPAARVASPNHTLCTVWMLAVYHRDTWRLYIRGIKVGTAVSGLIFDFGNICLRRIFCLGRCWNILKNGSFWCQDGNSPFGGDVFPFHLTIKEWLQATLGVKSTEFLSLWYQTTSMTAPSVRYLLDLGICWLSRHKVWFEQPATNKKCLSKNDPKLLGLYVYSTF